MVRRKNFFRVGWRKGEGGTWGGLVRRRRITGVEVCGRGVDWGAGTKAVESRDNGPVFLEHRVL